METLLNSNFYAFWDFVVCVVCVYMDLQKSYILNAKYLNAADMSDAESENLQ